ncbi:MAG: solute carrier family 23 protein [Mediterraneibacter faecis]
MFVIAIGLSLLPVETRFLGAVEAVPESFGSQCITVQLLVGLVTLIVCLVSRYLLRHGVYKDTDHSFVGLIFGWLYPFTVNLYCCWYCSMISFSGISKTIGRSRIFSLPRLVFFTGHTPIFDLGAFFTIAIVFLVSAAETTGATACGM